MKILEIIPSLCPGGAERFVVDLCSQMAVTKQNKVTLVLFYPIDKNNIYVDDIDSKVDILCLNKKTGLDFILILRLFKLLISLKPDIVHSHLRAFGYLIFSFIFNRSPKYIHTIHSEARHESNNSNLLIFIKRFIFRTKLCFPVTISKQSMLNFHHSYPRIITKLIENGRKKNNALSKIVDSKVLNDFEQVKKSKETIVFVNVASVIPLKNQVMLIECITELNNEGYDTAAILIGSLPDLRYKRRVESILTCSISILGIKSNPLEYLKLADAFCLCSNIEAMPISLIESFSVGTIPICTPAGGIPDMITNGENGFLSKDLSKESYKNALIKFLNLSKNELTIMASKSEETFERFCIEKSSSQYLQLMNQLIN